MEQNIIQTDIHRAVEAIKVAILQTRRKVMIQANKDSLALNYSIGGYISYRTNVAAKKTILFELVLNRIDNKSKEGTKIIKKDITFALLSVSWYGKIRSVR